jgi:hypothetical protein
VSRRVPSGENSFFSSRLIKSGGLHHCIATTNMDDIVVEEMKKERSVGNGITLVVIA